MGTYEWQSDFARKHVAIGREEVWKENKEKGRKEGERIGVAKMLLILLDTKSLTPNAEQEQRIRTCTDLDTLNTWFKRAIEATTVNDVFT